VSDLWKAFEQLLASPTTSLDDPWLEGVIDTMFSLFITRPTHENQPGLKLLPKLIQLTCEAALLDVDIDINSLKVIFFLTRIFYNNNCP